MRKLIIIGNGFDLSHGFETSYKSFLLYYLNKVQLEFFKIRENNNDTIYENPLIKIKTSLSKEKIMESINNKKLLDWFQFYNGMSYSYQIKKGIVDEQSVLGSDKYKKIVISIKSKLFDKIFDKVSLNWVDIENEYFSTILENIDDKDSLNTINNDLSYLKEHLITYLKEITQNNDNIIEKEYIRKFTENNPDEIMFLNFNYTNTIERYKNAIVLNEGNKLNEDSIKINYIHGSLDNLHGKPIFGIGDEHHKRYEELKNHENCLAAFRNSKSICYLKNGNYKDLQYFLGKYYDVEIYGHSCGLSDRTLLKYIFQNKNCIKIRIFHYRGEEDYSNKTIEILRHFDDPQIFRDKVETYNPGYSMNLKN